MQRLHLAVGTLILAGVGLWWLIARTTPDSGDEWIGLMVYAALILSIVVDVAFLTKPAIGQRLAVIELSLRVAAMVALGAATLTFLPAPGYQVAPLIGIAAVLSATAFIMDTLWRVRTIQPLKTLSFARAITITLVIRLAQLTVLGTVAAALVAGTNSVAFLFNGGALSGQTATVYQIVLLPPVLLVVNYGLYRVLSRWQWMRLPATMTRACLLVILIIALSAACSPVALTAVLQLDPAQSGRIITADFLGLSFEAPTLADSAFDPANEQLLNLLTTLGSGTLRFGGNEVEFTGWARDDAAKSATDFATIHPADLTRLFAFARAAGWRVILSVNLGRNTPERFADEASAAVQLGGESLMAIEIGNEPDLFMFNGQRGILWGYQDYRVELAAYLQAIRDRAPNIPIAAPATHGTAGLSWFNQTLTDHKQSIQLATHHFYPLTRLPIMLWGLPNAPSVDNLLSPAVMDRTAALVDQLVVDADAHGLPLQLDEMNSVADSGKAGVSDVFAASLWSIDTLFTLAEHGVRGVNFHTVWRCNTYTAICLRNGRYSAEPLYYGMLLFHDTVRGSAHTVPLTLHTNAAISAHAVIAADGHLRIVLINKDQSRDVPVQLNIEGRQSMLRASVIRLRAPSAYDHYNITFGNSKVNENGTWQPQQIETLPLTNNSLIVSMPSASVAVITIE